MKKNNYSKNKVSVGDMIITGTLEVVVAAAVGWTVRGVKHFIESTNWWQNKARPWIKKTYNKCEDWRDEAIDEVKEMFNKKND